MARSGVRLEVNPFFGFNIDIKTLVKEDKTSSFNMICAHDPIKDEDHDPSGVAMTFTCKVCSNDDRSLFKSGKVQNDGTVLIFDDDAVQEAKTGSTGDSDRVLRISAHPLGEVMERTVSTGKPYALAPATGQERPYAIFREAVISNPERGFLLEYAYTKSNVKLYSLKVFNDALVIQQVAWPEDLADLPDVPDRMDPADRDVLQAGAILDALVDDFDPEEYLDTRRQKVQQMIAQAQGVPGAVVEVAKGKVKPQQDLSGALDAALQAALAAKQAKQASSTATGKAPAKKTAAKKKEPAKA